MTFSTNTASRDPVLAWLLKGDPAIRWQVFRDLLGRPAREWRAEQARVATEGWGARLLACQDANGRWTRRLYGQKWISTTHSMVLRLHWGSLATTLGRSSGRLTVRRSTPLRKSSSVVSQISRDSCRLPSDLHQRGEEATTT